MNDPKDQEVIDALVNEVVLAVNMRLEAAAVECETNVTNLLCDTYGSGAECIASTEACAEAIRSFKVTPKQINVVRT